MKEVLVAAYYFPPYADVSWVRATKFCKYLPENGWKPRVITVDCQYYGNKVVDSLPPEVEDMDVRRIPYVPFPGFVILVKLLYPLIISFIAWRGREQFSAVYIVGSPYHPFVATALITRVLGIPSVLDFRDSWSPGPWMNTYSSEWAQKVTRYARAVIERIGVRYASSVVFATSVLQDEYAQFLPRYKQKFYTITNGYDPDDFEHLVPQKVCAERTIILIGKFYFYTPEVVSYFLGLLKEFPDLRFLYVGNEANIIRDICRKLNTEDRVIAMDHQPYAKALCLVAGADYGLVTTSLANGMGTKIFDYQALGKPTLCFVPKRSVIAGQFETVPSVIVCQGPHDKEVVKRGLQRLLTLDDSAAKADLNQFSRRQTAAALALILDILKARCEVGRSVT